MMEDKQLNVVFIGKLPFPNGGAGTKRRRYIIDYLNNHNISNKVLVTFYHKSIYSNEEEGIYGKTPYKDINKFVEKRQLKDYYRQGIKYLKKWFVPNAQNILLFPTVLSVIDFPFYLLAKKIGYKIVFDQVETSFFLNGKLSKPTWIYYYLNEFCSKIAYKRSASFVISSSLYNQNKRRYPDVPIEILPNSTPVLTDGKKKELNTVLQILYTGTYGEKEGVEYLIEGIIKANLAGCPSRAVLLGNAPEDLKEKYGNVKSVRFAGFVSEDELKCYLLESDILAMVRTNTEFANFGFPFKLSEYLSTGNVVIATKVGDVEKYLTDKRDAYLIEPESSDAICKAILHIKNNPKEALRVGSNGLNTMKEKFSKETIGNIFVKFLKKLE